MFWRRKRLSEPTRRELRAHQRKTVQLPATINPGARAAPCTVRDISPAGTQLLISSALPEEDFGLRIDGVGVFEGTVRWRNGYRVGASFGRLGPQMKERIAKL